MENTETRDIIDQAAVVAFHEKDSEIRYLLVTNRSRKRWILPKGIIDVGKTALETAAQEAFEEAGVHGNVDSDPLGVYQYKKWGTQCRVTIYKMEVNRIEADWPERDLRKRIWVKKKRFLKRADKRIPRKLLKSGIGS